MSKNFTRATLCASLVTLTGTSYELTRTLPLEQVEFLQESFGKLGTHITKKDEALLFSPTGTPRVRSQTLTLPEIDVQAFLAGILPLLLFSNTNLEITLQGVNHSPETKTIAWYHELLFRYLRQYMGAYSLQVPKARMTSEGEFIVRVQSKQQLSRVTPPLVISPQEQLTHIAVQLIEESEERLDSHEKLLRLAYKKLNIPLRFSTRIAPFSALTQVLFYGSPEGYDNDHAFLHGSSYVTKKWKEEQLLAEVQKLNTLRSQTLLSNAEAELLLPIMALTGGSMPVNASEYTELLTFLSDILSIDFYTSETLCETEGYSAVHAPEVLDVDDI